MLFRSIASAENSNEFENYWIAGNYPRKEDEPLIRPGLLLHAWGSNLKNQTTFDKFNRNAARVVWMDKYRNMLWVAGIWSKDRTRTLGRYKLTNEKDQPDLEEDLNFDIQEILDKDIVPLNIQGIWGYPDTGEVFLIGDNRLILFDKLDEPHLIYEAPADTKLIGIWGSTARELWIVGYRSRNNVIPKDSSVVNLVERDEALILRIKYDPVKLAQ